MKNILIEMHKVVFSMKEDQNSLELLGTAIDKNNRIKGFKSIYWFIIKKLLRL